MAMFVSKKNSVRRARRNMCEKKMRITSHSVEYRLDGDNYTGACINEFDKVVIPNTQNVDDGGIVVFCNLFRENEFCENRKCPLHARNMEYVQAVDSYNIARSRRREVLRNLFGRKK